MKLFIPLAKAHTSKRIVEGIAASETPDRVGEIFDYASSKPHFQIWSQEFSKASDGKSLGNIRSMHANTAAGKLTSLRFNDQAKTIEVTARVIDDAEWRKVEEGVYTGFSIGGKYIKKWADGEHTRYTAAPSEISLVDLPCITNAQFTLVKLNGSTELRKFGTQRGEFKTMPTAVTIAMIFDRAKEIARKAAERDGNDYWTTKEQHFRLATQQLMGESSSGVERIDASPQDPELARKAASAQWHRRDPHAVGLGGVDHPRTEFGEVTHAEHGRLRVAHEKDGGRDWLAIHGHRFEINDRDIAGN